MSDTAVNELREVAAKVRRSVGLAHGYKIVNARTPIAPLAESVEEVGQAFARMLDKFAQAAAALEKQRVIDACEHPAPALADPRLSEAESLTWLECGLCHQRICPVESCHHRIGQHGEMGCRVEGCECKASHK